MTSALFAIGLYITIGAWMLTYTRTHGLKCDCLFVALWLPFLIWEFYDQFVDWLKSKAGP